MDGVDDVRAHEGEAAETPADMEGDKSGLRQNNFDFDWARFYLDSCKYDRI